MRTLFPSKMSSVRTRSPAPTKAQKPGQLARFLCFSFSIIEWLLLRRRRASPFRCHSAAICRAVAAVPLHATCYRCVLRHCKRRPIIVHMILLTKQPANHILAVAVNMYRVLSPHINDRGALHDYS